MKCKTSTILIYHIPTYCDICSTSNVTSRHRAPKCKRLWHPLVCVITTLYYVAVGQSFMLRTLYFSLSTLVSHDFSVWCMYSKFGHHPHPLSYHGAKFRFFRDLLCWASPWRKIAYSITHPAYLMPREPKRLHFAKKLTSNKHTSSCKEFTHSTNNP